MTETEEKKSGGGTSPGLVAGVVIAILVTLGLGSFMTYYLIK